MRFKPWLLGLAGVAMAAPVSAQDAISFSNAYNGYVQGTITGAVFEKAYGRGQSEPPAGRRNDGGGTTALTAPPRAQAAPASFRFKRNAAVSRRVRQELIDNVRRRDPSAASEIERALADRQIIEKYAQGVRPLGLRADDTVDSMTAYLITIWGVTNDEDPTATPAMVRAVRAQVASAYAGLTDFLKTDAQRQEVGESLIYQVLFNESLLERMKTMSAAERTSVADAVHKNTLPMLEFDMRRIVLTEAGFRDRKSGDANGAGGSAEPEQFARSEGSTSSSYLLVAAAGGVGLGAAFLVGKALARRG